MKKKETNETKQKNWQEKLFNKKWSNEMKKTTTKNKFVEKNGVDYMVYPGRCLAKL